MCIENPNGSHAEINFHPKLSPFQNGDHPFIAVPYPIQVQMDKIAREDGLDQDHPEEGPLLLSLGAYLTGHHNRPFATAIVDRVVREFKMKRDGITSEEARTSKKSGKAHLAEQPSMI